MAVTGHGWVVATAMLSRAASASQAPPATPVPRTWADDGLSDDGSSARRLRATGFRGYGVKTRAVKGHRFGLSLS